MEPALWHFWQHYDVPGGLLVATLGNICKILPCSEGTYHTHTFGLARKIYSTCICIIEAQSFHSDIISYHLSFIKSSWIICA